MKRSRFEVLGAMQSRRRRTCHCMSGHIHMSAGESDYCNILLSRKQSHQIKDYTTQKKYSLDVNGHHITNHVVDFVVEYADGHFEVEEFKGFVTDIWQMKKKLFEALYPELAYNVIWQRKKY